ncbi:GGDEF domain-containing protein [Hahella sp. SMD15-11]|uniref:diguanylate cyclase n=1 Tax=Thermohahella caldifontis TaxID=3142973 RepID=A0AB39UTV7_9GAMM
MNSLPVDRMHFETLADLAERTRRMRALHINWINYTLRKLVCHLPVTEADAASAANPHECEVGKILDSLGDHVIRESEAFVLLGQSHVALHEAMHGLVEAARVKMPVDPAIYDRYVAAQKVFFTALDDFLWDLEHLCSQFDPLTQLPNRQLLDKVIAREMNRAGRHGVPLSLVMMDLDHFKSVNDTWGHEAGDRVLKTVARVLRESLRDYDIAGRFGGEEFLILLPETPASRAEALMQRLRRKLAALTWPELDQRRVTASFGVAQYEPGDLPADLIRRADEAMYEAKSCGRNCVRVSG